VSAAEAALCVRRGDWAGAEAAVARALAVNPHDADALNILAMVRHQRGDIAGALDALGQQVAAAPNDVAAHFNRATLLHQQGRLEEAVHGYSRTLALEPRDVVAWISRAQAEHALGRHEDAARSCAEALEVDPKNPTALNDGAAALGRLGRLDEALALFDRLVKLTPESAAAQTNRGKVLAELGRFEEACAAYEQALKHDPKHAPAWNNLGVARAALGLYDEAVAAYEQASRGSLQHFETGHPVFNKAAALLMKGDYVRGFAHYAQRFAARAAPAPPQVETALPWIGVRVEGLLRVRGEQGVGDQLLFTRLLPLVLERTPRVAIDCDPRIAGLLRRGYPALEAVFAPNETRGDVIAHVAMGDIAGLLQLTADRIAALAIVLRADEAKLAPLRKKYLQLANGRPIVGLTWASPRAKLGRSKSAALEHWGALLREPYFFVSLQYGDDRADIEAAQALYGCDIHHDDSVDQMSSIEDFAAQLAALDHIVTVSNTTAHVAGALGLRAFVLAPPGHGLHWYWGAEGSHTPWYPSLTLVRRALGAAWEGQVAEAAALVRDALLR
jgi:tetratricopeptide (TPR) repeat protein